MKVKTKLMAKGEMILLKHIGEINPDSIDDYIRVGGYEAARKALSMKQLKVIEEVKKSGLTGRGGAGFPTGKKWEFTYNAQGDQKYVVCNADEGEPGTVKDRILMEGNPHLLIEGMIIAGYAVGATKGHIYIRGEYRESMNTMYRAIEQAYEKGFLGKGIFGTDFDFDLVINEGAGAYVCGEETALINSIEGKRGGPRLKPPYPPQAGLWQKPTVVNNVETLCNIPHIVRNGGEWYSKIGTPSAPGTKLFILSGDVKVKGVVEAPMDITLKELIYDFGEGIKDDAEFYFAQVGGASGNLFDSSFLDKAMDPATLREYGKSHGTGAVLVAAKGKDITCFLTHVAEFFEHESCGKCTPCREGTHRIRQIMESFRDGKGKPSDLELLVELGSVMKRASFCGLGQAAPNPFLDAVELFKEDILAK